jgi:hypothetical protein
MDNMFLMEDHLTASGVGGREGKGGKDLQMSTFANLLTSHSAHILQGSISQGGHRTAERTKVQSGVQKLRKNEKEHCSNEAWKPCFVPTQDCMSPNGNAALGFLTFSSGDFSLIKTE